MSRCLPFIALFSMFNVIKASGLDNICVQEALSDPSSESIQYDGYKVLFVPYDWCTQHCPGWAPFSRSDIALVLFQFILPTVITSLNVPRRWHLDLPESAFDIRAGWRLLKIPMSIISVGFIATIDMIAWVGIIIALAGPMIVSGLVEMWLDLVTIRALANSHNIVPTNALTTAERIDLVIAMLCGNFEDHENHAATDRLKIVLSNQATSLDVRKAQLASIMNGQAVFGATVGIPVLFFLGNFLYNALDITDETAFGIEWTPYAIWLMVMIHVAVVSGTQLTGMNPSVASVITGSTFQHPNPRWLGVLTDYYNGELHPVTTYDRGTTKRSWYEQTSAAQHNWYRQQITIKKREWVLLCLVACFLTLFPGIMAYSLAHRLPWPRQGCRTFTYILYMICQIALILMAIATNIRGEPLLSSRPHKYSTSNISYLVVMSLFATTALAIALAGGVFQIFGIYNSCWCLTPLWHWTWSVDHKWVELLAGSFVDDWYKDASIHYAISLTWASAVVTGVITYMGYWYQKAVRRAVTLELGRL
ncbi:hypothetical protein MMC09_000815 [Bachmanniomyces sp. S44760]|nr:hypothetical protein [Bachmanniomyces sp. S44760]